MARKQHKYHFIYRTVNQVNGKWYMGMHSTDNLEDGYIGSGKRLWYSIRKYGRENFKMEIQEFLSDRRSLKDREKEIVNEGLLKNPMCMNLKLGGEGGFANEEHRKNAQKNGALTSLKKMRERLKLKLESDIEFQKSFGESISKSKSGEKNPFFGKSHSDEYKKMISEHNSSSQKGEKNSQFGTVWISKDGKNCKIKKESLEQFLKDGWTRGRKMLKR